MLPPVDSAVLKANPQFGALYHNLCNTKLNEDGSSKLGEKALYEYELLYKGLKQYRIEATKREIIKNGLIRIASSPANLPDGLQDSVEVFAALLNGEVAREDYWVVEPELENLRANVRPVAVALSKYIQHETDTIATVLDPDHPPQASDMLIQARKLKKSVADLHVEVGSSRLALAQDAVDVQRLQREVMEASILVLEQSLHGLVARSSRTKAEYIALMSEGMSKKLSIQRAQLLSQVHSSAFEGMMLEKCEEWKLESKAISRKIDEARMSLKAHGEENGVPELVREYGEICSEIEKIEKEILRLEEGM